MSRSWPSGLKDADGRPYGIWQPGQGGAQGISGDEGDDLLRWLVFFRVLCYDVDDDC